LAGDGLGKSHGFAGGLADVGVVQETVDGGGGQGFGHEFVKTCRVQVRGDRHGSFLVGGIDEAVETFGGVGRYREQAYVIDLCGYLHRSIYADTATMPRRAWTSQGLDQPDPVQDRVGGQVNPDEDT